MSAPAFFASEILEMGVAGVGGYRHGIGSVDEPAWMWAAAWQRRRRQRSGDL